jgi:fatty-acyl-CoA synthase
VHDLGVGSWVARRARRTPGRVALIDGDRRVTYAELGERVTRLAHGLRGLGVQSGDRVAYLGPNHPSLLETLFAAGTLGAAFVPLNFRLAAPELAFAMRDAGARVLVFAAEHAAAIDRVRAEVDLAHAVVTGEGAAPFATDYEALVARSPREPIEAPVPLETPCLLLYTSGTTGQPKAATLTHANVTWNAFNVLVDADVASDEVSLVSAPLFHSGALGMQCLPTLLKGGTAVLQRAFDAERALDAVEAHRVTWMFGVPTMFAAIARSPRWRSADLSSLRLLLCGGAPVPPDLIRAYLDRGLPFVQGYGMTEAAPGALLLEPAMRHRVGSAGQPHFFTDVRVAQPDGSPAAPGEAGEILVRGPNVMDRYWNRPDATAAALQGGWFRSGDAGVADEEGFVFVKDRLKDMFISGGENVSPAEVEAVIRTHPGVEACAVIGVPDATWGEVGRAIVVARGDLRERPAELLAYLDGKIARYKIPRSVVVVDALPQAGPGKVDKVALRQRYGTP